MIDFLEIINHYIILLVIIMDLKSCPFCGEEDIELKTEFKGNMNHGGFGWSAVCICTHCCANGSHQGGNETEEEAIERAGTIWNEAGRPQWYHYIIKKWNTMIYLIRSYINGDFN
jgi:hypothetical protein